VPRARTFTAKEVLEKTRSQGGAVVKFVAVRFPTGIEYRFQWPDSLVHHNEMLDAGEKATSAGFFTLMKSVSGEGLELLLSGTPSTSLQMTATDEDRWNLQRLFGLLGSGKDAIGA
jgi:hypothetical protein